MSVCHTSRDAGLSQDAGCARDLNGTALCIVLAEDDAGRATCLATDPTVKKRSKGEQMIFTT